VFFSTYSWLGVLIQFDMGLVVVVALEKIKMRMRELSFKQCVWLSVLTQSLRYHRVLCCGYGPQSATSLSGRPTTR
jgi:hypothetical protein